MDIQTERLIIRELAPGMGFDIHKNSLDPDTRRFVPDEVFETPQEAEAAVGRLMAAYQSPDGPFLYPVFTKEGENIGYVQACRIEEGFEIGYHIAGRQTGRGFATEAVRAFVPAIISELGVDRLFGIALEENRASHRVLEKCGFALIYKGEGLYQGAPRAIRKYLFTK